MIYNQNIRDMYQVKMPTGIKDPEMLCIIAGRKAEER